MLSIAICDDNNYICSQIEKIILDYQKYKCEKFDIDIFCTGENLINFIKNEHSFDLIFLDIELGTTTGIEIGSKIRNEFDDYISKIVFITSKDGYESQLFDFQPLNFLKKPIEPRKIHKCIDLSLKLLGIENNTFDIKYLYSYLDRLAEKAIELFKGITQ